MSKNKGDKKLTNDQKISIINMHNSNVSQKDNAELHGVSTSAVNQIIQEYVKK